MQVLTHAKCLAYNSLPFKKLRPFAKVVCGADHKCNHVHERYIRLFKLLDIFFLNNSARPKIIAQRFDGNRPTSIVGHCNNL